MKKLLAFAAALTLLCTTAFAEFDFFALKDTPDAAVYTLPGTADTVVRPMDSHFQGELGEDELVANLDYIILPDEEVATFRLCLSLSMFDSLYADEVRVTVDKKCYTFAVTPEGNDYDGIYMEDYALVLSSESFPMITALSKAKNATTVQIVFVNTTDGVERTGSVEIPSADVKAMLNRYNDLGGSKQDLSVLTEKYPCTVEKAK